jgi:predicted aspartyl protease
MSFLKNSVIAVAAFGVGFYASEYRHAANQQDDVNPVSFSQASSQAATSRSPAVVPGYPRQTPTVPGDTLSNPAAAPAPSLLERARQSIDRNEFPAAVQALNDLLQKDPANAEALLLLARVLEKQGKHQDAVATWFRYLNAEIDARKTDEALAYLSGYLLRLVKNPGIFGASREWLITQLNDLIKLTPDNGELHLQLAEMHLKTADQEQAQYHALMAANQEKTRARAEEFIARMADEALAGQTVDDEINVALVRYGNQFLVPVSVEGEPVKLLLDTGASISGLTSHFLNRNYSLVKSPKPIQLNTASGTVDSYLFTVETLEIAELKFNKHMLARLPMDNHDAFDGLLGVDILGRFDFVIDQQKAILRLRKRQ